MKLEMKIASNQLKLSNRMNHIEDRILRREDKAEKLDHSKKNLKAHINMQNLWETMIRPHL